MKIYGWPWRLRKIVRGQPDREVARARIRQLRGLLSSCDDWASCRKDLAKASMFVDAKGSNGLVWITILPTLKIGFLVTAETVRWQRHHYMKPQSD